MQVCDNYAIAASKCGEYTTAAGAFVKTVQQSGGRRVNVEVLEELLAEVHRVRGAPADGAPAAASAEASAAAGDCGGVGAQVRGHGADEEDEDDAHEDDAALGAEAARILDALAAVKIGVEGPPAGRKQVEADEDALARRRGMLVRPGTEAAPFDRRGDDRCACVCISVCIAGLRHSMAVRVHLAAVPA